MAAEILNNTEVLAAEAFGNQSIIFDEIYSPNTIIQYKRARVRTAVEKHLSASSYILELNAGTGEDAIYFAHKGHKIHASDIADGMLGKLTEKVKNQQLELNITAEKCSYTELDSLKNKGPFDLIFSNFAGLNCTDKLQDVLHSFDPLLKQNGLVTLVIMPPFSLWEIMFALQGKFKTAFRRFNSKNGAKAHIDGHFFTCWYYKPSYIINVLKDKYELLELEGLSTITPPSAFENFPRKHPYLFQCLVKMESRFKDKWPWKYIGDYYIITLRKK